MSLDARGAVISQHISIGHCTQSIHHRNLCVQHVNIDAALVAAHALSEQVNSWIYLQYLLLGRPSFTYRNIEIRHVLQ